MAERVSSRRTGSSWIQGHGWDQERWPDARFPTASDLDEAAPHDPVILLREERPRPGDEFGRT